MDLLPAIAAIDEPRFTDLHLYKAMLLLRYDSPADGEVDAELTRLEEAGLLESVATKWWWEIAGGGMTEGTEVKIYWVTDSGRASIAAHT